MVWNLRLYIGANGERPVLVWLRSLDPKAKAAVIEVLDLLTEFGTSLERPHVAFLGEGLWELRARGPDGIYRVIYFHIKGRSFGLLHGFTKKTQKTPRREIEIAKERRGSGSTGKSAGSRVEKVGRHE
jgi:phage-related protein